MKRTFTLLAVLITIVTFSQNVQKDATSNKNTKGLATINPREGISENATNPKKISYKKNKVQSSLDKNEVITDWKQASDCFPQIYYQLLVRSPEHPRNYAHNGTYSVWVKFKTTTPQSREQFWVTFKVPNTTTGKDVELQFSKPINGKFQHAFNEVHTTTSVNDVEYLDITKLSEGVVDGSLVYDECVNGVIQKGQKKSKKSTSESVTSNTPKGYTTTPYDSPLNSNNPNYRKTSTTTTSTNTNSNTQTVVTPVAKKTKKVIPETFFVVDKNVEPKDMLENLITILKNLGYTYEETTYQKLLPEIPYGVYFKEFILTFDTKLPDYDYTLRKNGKRWVTGLNFSPRDGDILRGKCDDCRDLRINIKMVEN